MSPRDDSAAGLPTAGQETQRRGFGMALMVASSLVISFGGVLVRAMEGADALQINFYRALALIGAVSVLLVVQYRGETIARVRGIGRPGLFGGVILGAAGVCFMQALTTTTVANTLFILSSIPFITAALARLFLGERLTRATLITMVVASAGVGVMVLEGFEAKSLYGNLMALATAICFSSFAVTVRRHRGVDMLPTLLISAALIALVSLITRWDDLGISWHDMVLCFLYGGLLSGFANWTFIIASRHLVAAEVTLFMLLEFSLGPLWVWLFIGEVPAALTLAGGALVMTAVALRAGLELGHGRQLLKRGRLPGPP
ncbi:MAG: DMT family transporter [Pseudomonadota bacterium]